MELANPEWLFALVLIPILIGFYVYRHFTKNMPHLSFHQYNFLSVSTVIGDHICIG